MSAAEKPIYMRVAEEILTVSPTLTKFCEDTVREDSFGQLTEEEVYDYTFGLASQIHVGQALCLAASGAIRCVFDPTEGDISFERIDGVEFTGIFTTGEENARRVLELVMHELVQATNGELSEPMQNVLDSLNENAELPIMSYRRDPDSPVS